MWVMGEWAVGQWIVGVTSFQKIFGLCGLKCHIVEIWRDVTLVDNGRTTTECEDRARILETEFAKIKRCIKSAAISSQLQLNIWVAPSSSVYRLYTPPPPLSDEEVSFQQRAADSSDKKTKRYPTTVN